MRTLAGELHHLPSLGELWLCGVGMGDAGAQALAEAVVAHPPQALAWLLLNNNTIGNEGARGLAGALSSLPKLEMLSLRCNAVGNAGAEALAARLQTAPALAQFFIQGNRLSSRGVAFIASAVPTCPTLVELRLGGMDMGLEGPRAGPADMYAPTSASTASTSASRRARRADGRPHILTPAACLPADYYRSARFDDGLITHDVTPPVARARTTCGHATTSSTRTKPTTTPSKGRAFAPLRHLAQAAGGSSLAGDDGTVPRGVAPRGSAASDARGADGQPDALLRRRNRGYDVVLGKLACWTAGRLGHSEARPPTPSSSEPPLKPLSS